MPRFAANIGDGWLYSNIPFMERIGAASKDGFTAVECGDTHYKYSAHKIRKQLEKYKMKFVLINTHSMPKYENRTDRKYHAIYHDERELFLQSLERAFAFAMIINQEMCIHIDIGKLTKVVHEQEARKQLIDNLKIAQKTLDDNLYIGNKFTLMIEAVSNIKGRGINNYYLWSQYEAVSIIKEVNANYKGLYPIYLQYDFFHAQTHHGDIMHFLDENIAIIKHIQCSQCPQRNEPCNEVDGDLNYSVLYKYLDEKIEYKYYVGLEYKPMDKHDTTKGLRLDNNWFKRFNHVDNMENKEDDEEQVAKLLLQKTLCVVSKALGESYTKQIGLQMIKECKGDPFLLVSNINFSSD